MTRRILAIIPAHSDDKNVPNKNMRKVNNQTLLSRAMHSAYPATSVSIASDSNNILTYAGIFEERLQHYPLLYFTKILLGDDMETVIAKSIDNCGPHDLYVYLNPANPLREQNDVKAALKVQELSSAGCVIGVSPSKQTVSIRLANDKAGFAVTESNVNPSGNLATINESIYIFTHQHWKENKTKLGTNARALIMDSPKGLAIQYEKDLKEADIWLRAFSDER
jgi:CMP-N-acetylneuraminic acid synthetase